MGLWRLTQNLIPDWHRLVVCVCKVLCSHSVSFIFVTVPSVGPRSLLGFRLGFASPYLTSGKYGDADFENISAHRRTGKSDDKNGDK